MPDRNTVPFNSMIAGYAQPGLGTEALLLFEEMLESDNPPTSITFISVLSACAHTERIDEGFGYFNSVRDKYGVEPEEEHHSCMIDLLARAGKFEGAEETIKSVPFDLESIGWAALLGACRTHGDLKLGTRAAEELAR